MSLRQQFTGLQPKETRDAGGVLLGSRGLSIADRLWEKIDRKDPWECWPWLGARTRGARKRVFYGSINEGGMDGGNSGKSWRAHILMLCLQPESTADVPPEEGELLVPWLYRVKAHWVEYFAQDCAHLCDNSLCCNPNHLAWQSHPENLAGQLERDRLREQDPGWVPECCRPETYLRVANAGEAASAVGEAAGL